MNGVASAAQAIAIATRNPKSVGFAAIQLMPKQRSAHDASLDCHICLVTEIRSAEALSTPAMPASAKSWITALSGCLGAQLFVSK